jgi:hypothetical protein
LNGAESEGSRGVTVTPRWKSAKRFPGADDDEPWELSADSPAREPYWTDWGPTHLEGYCWDRIRVPRIDGVIDPTAAVEVTPWSFGMDAYDSSDTGSGGLRFRSHSR